MPVSIKDIHSKRKLDKVYKYGMGKSEQELNDQQDEGAKNVIKERMNIQKEKIERDENDLRNFSHQFLLDKGVYIPDKEKKFIEPWYGESEMSGKKIPTNLDSEDNEKKYKIGSGWSI